MNKNIIFIPVLLAIIVSSCTSTKIASSWREPGKSVRIAKLNKVLLVAMFKDETSRHKAEDQMAAYLKGKGIESYNYLDPNFDKNNEDLLREKMKKDGFDGAVTMRLVDVDKEKMYSPGSPYYPAYFRSFRGYYYRSWSIYSQPGYYETTKTYKIEVNVYSIVEDRIIWSGLTETANPDGVERLTGEVSKAVFKKMLREGFIDKEPA